MKLITQHLTRFFIYSNLFIACCALLMVNQTTVLLLNVPPPRDFMLFVLFSTICSYSFHWYLTSESLIASDRIAWVNRNRHVHGYMFIIGAIGSGIFFFYLLPWWPWLLLGAVITFLYSAPKIPHPWFRALRKVALGKTVFLAMVWTYVTTVLPLIISGSAWRNDMILFVIARFFLVYAICILFDYRDRGDDRAAGIRSLITLLDERGISLLFFVSLAISGISYMLLLYYHYTATQIVVLVLPVLITGLLFKKARRHIADAFYYFILDGLMALSALLMLIPGI
jgi:4-hydroxybenzoate polyprenyltransferase